MKRLKRIAALLLAIVMAFSLSGCGFSVGDSNNKEDYADLFPDRAATLDKNYKTSNMGYKFSVGEYEMMIYVDTSEGHKFEVISEPAGFKVTDEAGEDVLYAACMEKDQYELYTAYCTDTKTVNGRDFFYMENGDGSVDCFSYMADCGVDYGLVMEVKGGNNDAFSLVAFRGEPLEGASSDLYFYKGDLSELLDFSDEVDASEEYDDSLS